MGPDWAGVIVAVLVGVANLAVTLWLNRRRQGEIEAQRRATEAKEAFAQDVSIPLRSCLHELESLRAKIVEAAGQATESERQRAARQIFRNEKTQVLAAFDRPLASAMLWSRDAGDVHLTRLRDLEVQIDLTLDQLANNDELTTTHRISESSRRLSAEVLGFSTSCRVWLNEIAEGLSTGRVQPPAHRSGHARAE
jgi:hypothetical protein